ncbi:hypothetical protein DPMN_072285 [Dreissena polymorpha]|uniref:Uncharacterized protein n=1 Tax=Dreissena polymorpha TaxID=45954 RepID=A0A9D4BWQ4_DREPO|nr:hypothetical protein DPMN_072285 [Dreissena polymorpha]
MESSGIGRTWASDDGGLGAFNLLRDRPYGQLGITVVEVPHNPDDGNPLARLAAIFGFTSSINDYISIDNNLQANEDISDDDTLQDLPDIEPRGEDTPTSSDEEDIQLRHPPNQPWER